MNGWLLDTNVVSELRKIRPNRRVKEWSDAQAADAFFLSTITIAEIRFGVERQTEPSFRRELQDWLDHRLRPWFAGRILPVDEDVILEWRRMVARGKERALTFSQPRPLHRRHRKGAFADALYAEREGFRQDEHPGLQSLVRMIPETWRRETSSSLEALQSERRISDVMTVVPSS